MGYGLCGFGLWWVIRWWSSVCLVVDYGGGFGDGGCYVFCDGWLWAMVYIWFLFLFFFFFF